MHLVEAVVCEAGALRARGGEVLLLRLPSSGEVRRIEHLRLPRERYWDVLVERSGLQAIHFEDYSELRGFDCPDGSHLDVVDAKEFTRRLAPILDRALSRRSFLDGS